MNCTLCQSYKDTSGHGGPACLKCKTYKQFQIKDAKRQTIKFEIIPQAIMEQIEDLTKKVDMLEMIRKLPLELSVPVMMYWILGCTQQEVADFLHCSQPMVIKKNRKAIECIKKCMQ